MRTWSPSWLTPDRTPLDVGDTIYPFSDRQRTRAINNLAKRWLKRNPQLLTNTR